MKPTRAVSLLEGIRAAVAAVDGKNVEITYNVGAYAHKMLPLIGTSLTLASSGKKGFELSFWNEDPFEAADSSRLKDSAQSTRACTLELDDSYCFMSNDPVEGITSTVNFARLVGTYTPDQDCDFEFSLTCAGVGRLFVDGKRIVNNWEDQKPGSSFFGGGSAEGLSAHLPASSPVAHLSSLIRRFHSPSQSPVAHRLTSRTSFLRDWQG